MKYFIIAGEASGDAHAARLIDGIKDADPDADIRGFGGDEMKKAGAAICKHYRDMAYMGLIPVLLHLPQIARNFRDGKRELLLFSPHVLILVDYAGFNLRMAQVARREGIPTAYYISPKIWAWNTKRVWKIKERVDKMYTIFPFETGFYARYGYPVQYVGNPVFDAIKRYRERPVDPIRFREENQLGPQPIVALLPGSRQHEIRSLLPVMEQTSLFVPDYQYVIAGAPGINPAFYRSLLQTNIPVIYGKTYDLLTCSHAALVASGTATLETALLNVPQVVCYKMGFGWFLERYRDRLLKTRFFSLVNLVADREVVREYFQSQVTPENLKMELSRLLDDLPYRERILEGYREVTQILDTDDEPGSAVARSIVGSLREKKNGSNKTQE